MPSTSPSSGSAQVSRLLLPNRIMPLLASGSCAGDMCANVCGGYLAGLEHQFPPKKIGKLSPEQTEKRRQQLEAFLRELVDTILSPPVKLALHDFLDIKDEAPPLPDPPSSTPPRAQQPDRSSSAAEEGEGVVVIWP